MSKELCFFQTRIYLYWILMLYVLLVYFTGIGESGIIIYDGEDNIEEFSDSELPFARPITKYGLEGAVINANPVDACTEIAGPPNISSSLNWFVLIAGNFCDYNTKLKNSAYAGYSAAIIYSLRGKDDGPIRQRHDLISNISGVTIRTSSGLIIKDNYLYTIDSRYRMYIFRNNAFNIITFVLLFAIVAGIFMVVMLAFLLRCSLLTSGFTYSWFSLSFSVAWFWISLTSNHFYANWHFSIKKYILLFITVGFFAVFLAVPLGIVRFVHQAHTFHETCLSTQHLRQLQTSRFQKGDPYETCAICLEDYKAKDKLRILPCSHGYHASCIDPWLTKNRRICPVCKQKVVLANEFSDIESDTESRSETAPLLNRNVPSNSYRAMSDNSNVSSLHSQLPIISETPHNTLVTGNENADQNT